MKLNKRLKQLMLVWVLACVGNCETLLAQVCGYGIGTNTISATTHSSGDLYTDNNRAEVNGITYSTNNDYVTVTLNGTYTYGSFSTGDAVIIIQMEGTTGNPEGVHRNGIIDQIYTSGGVTYYKVDAVGCNTNPVFPTTLTVGSGYVLQMININEYASFTLSSGRVTCHAWDGHTGGVLCMVTTGNLTVNGGYFDVSGKGYYDDNITWGAGGTGGTGTAGGTGGTGTAANSTVELCTGTLWATTAVTHQGSAGYVTTSANDGGSGSTISGSTTTRVNPAYGTKAVMGNPGSFTSGKGGGDGAQGGAGGGNGGVNTTCSLAAGNGASGQSGGNGGASGESGRGAGVIIIKIGGNLVRGSGLSSTILFWANGINGTAGIYGGTGGQGGIGGTAALGCCSGGTDITCTAGGSGQSGTGGDGGDGGNGGKAGCIWLAASGTNGMSSANVQAKGGAGGVGGPAGWGYSGTPAANSTEYKNSNCHSNSCGTGGSGGSGSSTCPSWTTVEICNAEKVFCLLGQNALSAKQGNGTNDVDFYDGANGTGNLIGQFSETSGTTGFSFIYALEDDATTCTHYHYFTLLFSPDICTEIFKSMKDNSGAPGLPAPADPGTLIDFTNTSVNNCPAGSGGWVDVTFVDNVTTADAIHYGHGEITDLISVNHPVCYAMFCPPTDLFSQGTNGQVETAGSGTAGDDGTDAADETGTADNVTLEGGASWKRLPTEVQQKMKQAKQIRCYPNPATKELTIETPVLKTPTACVIQLCDITGKIIYNSTRTLDGSSKFTLDVAGLSRGVYLLKVTGEGIDSFTQKITLQ